MVESTALEMRRTRKGIGGSNPSLSAILLRAALVTFALGAALMPEPSHACSCEALDQGSLYRRSIHGPLTGAPGRVAIGLFAIILILAIVAGARYIG